VSYTDEKIPSVKLLNLVVEEKRNPTKKVSDTFCEVSIKIMCEVFTRTILFKE